MLHSISSKKIAYTLGVGFGLHQLTHQTLSATWGGGGGGGGGGEFKSIVQTCNSRTNRPDIRLCLVVHMPMVWITCQNNKASTSIIRVACESNLRSVVKSSMPRKQAYNQARVVYYARTAQAYSAGIKCRHCT